MKKNNFIHIELDKPLQEMLNILFEIGFDSDYPRIIKRLIRNQYKKTISANEFELMKMKIKDELCQEQELKSI